MSPSDPLGRACSCQADAAAAFQAAKTLFCLDLLSATLLLQWHILFLLCLAHASDIYVFSTTCLK